MSIQVFFVEHVWRSHMRRHNGRLCQLSFLKYSPRNNINNLKNLTPIQQKKLSISDGKDAQSSTVRQQNGQAVHKTKTYSTREWSVEDLELKKGLYSVPHSQ